LKVHWMRYLIGDAGNLQRMYLAVKTASENGVENLQTLCEIYLRKYRHLTTEGSRKRGLMKSEWRSAEPHFSLARELDLLEWRERERWRMTFGAGRTYLSLCDNNSNSVPMSLLLHQLMTYDRTFTVPFLIRLVEADYDFVAGKFVGLEKYVRQVWEEIWEIHGRELQNMEPPLPKPPKKENRTLLHHGMARVRFLNKREGLHLNIDRLNKLAHQFHGFEDSDEMPPDSFFRIGTAISGREPSKMNETEITESILLAFYSLQRADHASGYGIYLYVNEKALPEKAVDWKTFTAHLRKGYPFSTRTSFRRDDYLVTVESRRELAE